MGVSENKDNDGRFSTLQWFDVMDRWAGGKTGSDEGGGDNRLAHVGVGAED